MPSTRMEIGIISDTHGYLSPKVFAIFSQVQHIIHAGDVGHSDILIELGAIAPVTAVRGNVDGFDLSQKLKELEELEFVGHRLQVRHIPRRYSEEVNPSGGSLIKIFGHTHIPFLRQNGLLTIINPGSASKPMNTPPSVALLHLEWNERPNAEIIYF